MVSERPQIGLLNEHSLHASIKKWYSLPGDEYEVRVDGFIIDIVRGDLLIEIQTRNFASIREKLGRLTKGHPVLLIYPIPREKWLVRVPVSGGGIIRRRKSPKRGRLTDLFDELVRIPDLIANTNLTLEVLMTREEEVRCDDGKGSWRRKGVSIVDRRLIDVIETARFTDSEDYLGLLPEGLHAPFSNKSLAKSMGVSVHTSRRMTYCLKRMGAIRQVGKIGNELLFEIAR